MKQPAPIARAERLGAFIDLLDTWRATVNLVSSSTGDLWRRHVDDSLQLEHYVAPGTERAIDIGSGAGFPGLVLAIATGVPFDLVEADRRKAAFLVEAGRVTDAPVRVIAARIESADLQPAPLVTARALAPLDRLFTLAKPLLLPGGLAILPKGRSAADEIAQARRRWVWDMDVMPSRTDPSASILLCRNIRHA